MGKLFKKIEGILNRVTLKKQLMIIFVLFLLLPLVITNWIVIYKFASASRQRTQQELMRDAETIRFAIQNRIEYPRSMFNKLYQSRTLEEFLDKRYEDAYEYYENYIEITRNSVLDNVLMYDDVFTIYVDNDTILNGGSFSKLSAVRDETWYNQLQESNGTVLLFYYGTRELDKTSKRRVILLRKLESSGNRCEKILKLEMNYNSFVSRILNDSISSDVYICKDDKVIMSNATGNHYLEPYSYMSPRIKYQYKYDFTILGSDYTIYLKSRGNMLETFFSETIYTVLLILVLSVIIPGIVIFFIGRSITTRIYRLQGVFDNADKDELVRLDDESGEDEISTLINKYNVMADRMNELIQTVYKDKIQAQEMDIARKNAELLALHSQINPHFLFNALESIRMHSIIRHETETAKMVEHLAMMERANVNWESDIVPLSQEAEFVEAYLELQKYRFGNRLSYEIDISDEARKVSIPKLTLVTFVENACVHGIESKTSQGWIFVRGDIRNDELVIEVEDTGAGIDTLTVTELQYRMDNASLEMLKKGSHVGMVNACLRLKYVTDNRVRFIVESEEAVGTAIQIIIPLENERESDTNVESTSC